jgi:hypothetical protein
MDQAVDLYRGGIAVLARETDHAAAATMRTACPRCLEPVHLVVRDTTHYFAHPPRSAESPPCPRRVDSGGGSASHGGSHQPLPPNTSFRDALLAAYSLTGPPPPPSGGADAGEAAAVLHRVLLSEGRTVTAADFADASPLLRDWWRGDEEMVRGFLDRPGLLSERLRDDLRRHPELATDEHRRSVLLLWQHLHSPRVVEDLLLLLQVTAHLFRPLLLADLVVTSLGVLSWVPWTALQSAGEAPTAATGPAAVELAVPAEEEEEEEEELTCSECGRGFTPPAGERPAVCSECGEELCPDCVIPCSGCGDVLCEHCLFRTCPACNEALCSTCWHFEWQCLGCEEWYCEGGREEKPEEVAKTECSDCGEGVCPDCVEDVLRDAAGDLLCETCWDDRAGDQMAARSDPG